MMKSYTLISLCPVCKLHKQQANHTKCSKILQAMPRKVSYPKKKLNKQNIEYLCKTGGTTLN